MAVEKARKNLGRGLASLFGDASDGHPTGEGGLDAYNLKSADVPIEDVVPSSLQPRLEFDADQLAALSESIKTNGIIQPILVRRSPENKRKWEIVAGERRWRAAQLAQKHTVPIVIRDLDDSRVLQIALVENLQRADLNPLEEAAGYQRLIKEYYHSHQGLADIIGKSRSHIANTIRLLNLPEQVLMAVKNGAISAGHGRALLGAKKPEMLLHQVTSRELNVRQTEALVKAKNSVRKARGEQKDSNTLELERDLTNLLGLRVSIKSTGESGKITINFNSLEQLDEVLLVLRGKQPGVF